MVLLQTGLQQLLQTAEDPSFSRILIYLCVTSAFLEADGYRRIYRKNREIRKR